MRNKLVEHYTPSHDDVSYMEMLANILNENGVWGFPGAQLMYRVSKLQKTFTLLNPEQLLNPHSLAMHERTIIVMWHLGYAVLPNTIGGVG